MGIFDFLIPKKNESKIIKKLFPSLKGIDFDSISLTPKGQSPEKYFNSDIDGKWFFSVHNFAMIFKSFSDENYEKGLSNLLNSNGLDSNSMNEESSHYYFQGEGFKIEKPKSPGINLIIISNEDVAHKVTVDLRSFDKLNKTNIEWVNGIQHIYEGNDALKRFNLSKDLKNTALFFKEPEIEYIAIHIPTLNVAKVIINRIIKLNGGLDNYEEVNGVAGWKFFHEGDQFTIGYLPDHQAVRLNKNRPQEPEIISSDNKQENIYYFKNVKEIIDLIKSKPDVEIFVGANEYWDGVYQLSEDKKSDSIEHFEIINVWGDYVTSNKNEAGENIVVVHDENYDLKKQPYRNRYYIWARALINNQDLLKKLNEFLEDDNYDQNSELYEFFEFMELPQTPDEAISYFEHKNYKEGTGREIGDDDISWAAEVYVREAEIELYSLSVS